MCTPEMIGHRVNQLSEAIPHLGVAVVSGHFNRAKKFIGRFIIGTKDGPAYAGVLKEVNRHGSPRRV